MVSTRYHHETEDDEEEEREAHSEDEDFQAERGGRAARHPQQPQRQRQQEEEAHARQRPQRGSSRKVYVEPSSEDFEGAIADSDDGAGAGAGARAARRSGGRDRGRGARGREDEGDGGEGQEEGEDEEEDEEEEQQCAAQAERYPLRDRGHEARPPRRERARQLDGGGEDPSPASARAGARGRDDRRTHAAAFGDGGGAAGSAEQGARKRSRGIPARELEALLTDQHESLLLASPHHSPGDPAGRRRGGAGAGAGGAAAAEGRGGGEDTERRQLRSRAGRGLPGGARGGGEEEGSSSGDLGEGEEDEGSSGSGDEDDEEEEDGVIGGARYPQRERRKAQELYRPGDDRPQYATHGAPSDGAGGGGHGGADPRGGGAGRRLAPPPLRPRRERDRRDRDRRRDRGGGGGGGGGGWGGDRDRGGGSDDDIFAPGTFLSTPIAGGGPGAFRGGQTTPGLHGGRGGGGGPPAGWDFGAPPGGAAGGGGGFGGGEARRGDGGHELAALAGGKEAAAAGAEITPLAVGGLDHYIRSLKEMIFLPLLYPELFDRFGLQPPRGVLFYGPPGTGKTLVARALAAQASRAAGQRVSFFMRKGADLLSKWVGEAERQLRLLFEEAARHQPSIIFFDEIDGLAPVRSSKQDQIHNSIVSTLLALMDGLDGRGRVVVIGATNRPDALDGALRRPGRFDRELLFPLPNRAARKAILRIHTAAWAQPPEEPLVEELAGACVGYCGADIKALCTEAALAALRRRYPQIYESDDKLLVAPDAVAIGREDFMAAHSAVAIGLEDFMAAHSGITPAAHRAASSHARPLGAVVAPCLAPALADAIGRLRASFPPGSGQGHVAAALLHALEGLPLHAVGLPSLLADAGARSLEEALVHAFVEARRAAPALLYLPHLPLWWAAAPTGLRAALLMLVEELPPELPLLLVAVADAPADELEPEVLQLFPPSARFELGPPSSRQRRDMFEPIFLAAAQPPPPAAAAPPPPPPPLPKAPDALAAAEEARARGAAAAARAAWEGEQQALRLLRMALRDVTVRLLASRKWKDWLQPPDPQEHLEFYEAVTNPMDLSTILAKARALPRAPRVDGRKYPTPAAYLADIALIPVCARQYYGGVAAREVSSACALQDEAALLVSQRVPPDVAAAAEAVAARGGPAPPPPGVEDPEDLMRAAAAAAAATAAAAARRASGGGARGGGGGGGEPARALRGRRSDAKVDGAVLHEDPEALMRTLRAASGRPARVRGQPQPQQQQQEQQQQQQQEHAGAGEGDAMEVDGEAAAGEQQQQQQQQQQRGEEEEAQGGVGQQPEGAPCAGEGEAAAPGQPAGGAGHPPAAAAAPSPSPEALKPVFANGQQPAPHQAGEKPPHGEGGDAHGEDGTAALAGQDAAAASGEAAAAPPPPQQQQTEGHEQQPEQQQQQQPAATAADSGAAGAGAAAAAAGPSGVDDVIELPAAPAAPPPPPPLPRPREEDAARAGALLESLVAATAPLRLAGLEALHARLSRAAAAGAAERDRRAVLAAVEAEAAAGLQELLGAI
ncbi:MAG: hypothetical protein J3K34DRAFT_505681 [Monoraphidium minutum]|nr:MAG: hypothetical protein J3K34DRAFT_505681 [Monoraphidium minutum]